MERTYADEITTVNRAELLSERILGQPVYGQEQAFSSSSELIASFFLDLLGGHIQWRHGPDAPRNK